MARCFSLLHVHSMRITNLKQRLKMYWTSSVLLPSVFFSKKFSFCNYAFYSCIIELCCWWFCCLNLSDPHIFFFLFLGVGVLDGLLYAVGGHDGPLVRKSVECYNPETGQWVQIADMHLCRRNAGRKLPQESIIYTLLLFGIFCFEYLLKNFVKN